MVTDKVGELISRNLIYINSGSSVIKAAIIMRENNISCLVVKDKGEFVGIVTEKDIINKVVAEELYPGDVEMQRSGLCTGKWTYRRCHKVDDKKRC